MTNRNISSESREPQLVGVQLCLPWGEEKNYYDSSPSGTQSRSQHRMEVTKQDSQKVVIVIVLNKKSH
jgi:hypothetical protein